jgi:hypothetical protein
MYEYINVEKLMKTVHKLSRGSTKTVLPRLGVAIGKMTLGLFCMEFNPELNTKVEENSLRFPMVIYTPSNVQQ